MKYIFKTLFIILFIAGCSPFPDWDRLTDSTIIDDEDPYLSMEGSNVYLTYYNYSGQYQIKFTKSINTGYTWPPGNIKTIVTTANTYGISALASVSSNNSNIYISYEDGSNNLIFAKSTDYGESWPVILTIDSTLNVGSPTSKTSIGNNIYISYFDLTNDDIKFARSTDSDTNWSLLTIDSVSGVFSSSPFIAADGKNVYTCYLDLNSDVLKFAKSVNSGDSWSTPIVIATLESHNADSFILADDNYIYICYNDSTNNNIKLTKSEDYGNNWSFSIIKPASTIAIPLQLALSGSNLYIIYYDNTDDYTKFARSLTRGDAWLESKTIENDCSEFALTADDNNIVICYKDHIMNSLTFTRLTDYGETWE